MERERGRERERERERQRGALSDGEILTDYDSHQARDRDVRVVVALLWCCRGSVVVMWRRCVGAVLALLCFCGGGVVVVLWWRCADVVAALGDFWR